MRARMAAGSSVASWNKAVERAGPGRMPIWRRRSIEPVGADRLAGASAGQQPWGGALVSGGGVALAGGDQVKDETGERFGEYDRFPAEPQAYFVAAGLDVTEGKAADGGGLLGVEQDEQPGDPVLGLEGAVVQQLPGLFPAPFGVDDAGGPAHRVAGKSRLVSFWFLAQRMKCPVGPRWLVLARPSTGQGRPAGRRPR